MSGNSREAHAAVIRRDGRAPITQTEYRPNHAETRCLGWVQKLKSSTRAYVFGFAPESGLKSELAGGPKRANMRWLLDVVVERLALVNDMNSKQLERRIAHHLEAGMLDFA